MLHCVTILCLLPKFTALLVIWSRCFLFATSVLPIGWLMVGSSAPPYLTCAPSTQKIKGRKYEEKKAHGLRGWGHHSSITVSGKTFSVGKKSHEPLYCQQIRAVWELKAHKKHLPPMHSHFPSPPMWCKGAGDGGCGQPTVLCLCHSSAVSSLPC